MDDGNVLELFNGLTVLQAREFRKRIIPTLQSLRESIVDTMPPEPGQAKPRRRRTAKPQEKGGSQDLRKRAIDKKQPKQEKNRQ